MTGRRGVSPRLDQGSWNAAFRAAVQRRDLGRLAALMDHGRACGLTYGDMRARSGLDEAEWESLAYEVDTAESAGGDA